jgi:hypothetical protein
MKNRTIVLLCLICLAAQACAFDVQINSPQEATVLRTRPIVLNYSIDGYESPYRIEIKSNINGVLSTDQQAPYEKRVVDLWLEEGSHTITITAIDKAGHMSIKSVTITVEPPLLDARIASPKNGTYSGTVNFRSKIDGSPPYKVLWSSDVDGPLGREESFSTALSRGRHTITLKVVDSIALVAYASATIDFKPAPQVIVLSPQYDTAYGTVEFRANITGGIPPYNVVWSSDRDGVLGATDSFVKELTPGEHKITLSVTDSDGAVAEKEKRMTIKPALRVRIDSPANGTYRGLLVFNASVSGGLPPYSIVWVSSKEGFLSGSESFDKELSSGEHIITAKVYDSDQFSAEDETRVNILQENYMDYAIVVLGLIGFAYVVILFWRARNE